MWSAADLIQMSSQQWIFLLSSNHQRLFQDEMPQTMLEFIPLSYKIFQPQLFTCNIPQWGGRRSYNMTTNSSVVISFVSDSVTSNVFSDSAIFTVLPITHGINQWRHLFFMGCCSTFFFFFFFSFFEKKR